MMDPEVDQRLWQAWADKIHSLGLDKTAVFFLEALGPFAILGAQTIYLAKPLLDGLVPAVQLNSAARMLEDSRLIKKFTRMLREYPVL